jgi:hypothetical protein
MTAIKPARPLYHKDGREAAPGDEITSFRSEKYILRGWPTNGHNRVWVTRPDEEHQKGFEAEYFPSVFDLTWHKAEVGA